MLWYMISSCGTSISHGQSSHGFTRDSCTNAAVGVPIRPWLMSVCIARTTGLQRYC